MSLADHRVDEGYYGRRQRSMGTDPRELAPALDSGWKIEGPITVPVAPSTVTTAPFMLPSTGYIDVARTFNAVSNQVELAVVLETAVANTLQLSLLIDRRLTSRHLELTFAPEIQTFAVGELSQQVTLGFPIGSCFARLSINNQAGAAFTPIIHWAYVVIPQAVAVAGRERFAMAVAQRDASGRPVYDRPPPQERLPGGLQTLATMDRQLRTFPGAPLSPGELVGRPSGPTHPGGPAGPSGPSGGAGPAPIRPIGPGTRDL